MSLPTIIFGRFIGSQSANGKYNSSSIVAELDVRLGIFELLESFLITKREAINIRK